jgi:ubiquinone/menaquinone biosynthesis C-methylase UbiE
MLPADQTLRDTSRFVRCERGEVMPHGHSGAESDRHHHGDLLIRWPRLYEIGMLLWSHRGRRWRTDLTNRLDLRAGDRVLDVGCGTGRLAFELAGRVTPGGSVDGVDAATEMVNYAVNANNRLQLPVSFQTALAQRLPFPDETFAAATCTLVLHHIDPDGRQEAVNEIHRVLKPGGRLLIADFQAPRGGPARYFTRLVPRRALMERPVEQAIELLKAAGFANLIRQDTTTSWIGLVMGTKLSP